MKVWVTREADAGAVEALRRQVDLPYPIACALVGRGLHDPAAVGRFLDPRLSDLSDPFLLSDMDKAVSRLWRAVEGREPIAVFGDYDVDGITGTVLLLSVLTRLGGQVTPYLPNRQEEGYGLTLRGVERCLARCRPRLLLTVDCGTNAVEATRAVQAAGVDALITDHHELSGELAPASAVVNPKRGAEAHTRMLAGVGVAFKLCHALVKEGRNAGKPAAADIDLRDYLDLVAVGTIADIVPLRGENRILVKHGLARLNKTCCPGLQALIDVAQIRADIDTYHVAFGIAPRLNAAGRMSDPACALELLLTDHPARGRDLALALDAANRERQTIESRIVQEAAEEIDGYFNPDRDFGLVVGRDGWHVGVIGIVASRLCSQYRRPVVVVAFDDDGMGRGSCRSIEGFSLVEALGHCAAELTEFGGHDMAAGLQLQKARFEGFRQRFNEVAVGMLAEKDLRGVEHIDAWLDLDKVDWDLMLGIDRLRPFGQDNPAPVWAAGGVQVLGTPRVVGKGTQKQGHLKMTVAAGREQLDAIGFGMGDRVVPAGALDVAFQLQRNVYMGRESLQLRLRDIRPAVQ
ncbi:MAG: single-stranded-DNA-specific exonuclease RecJ [Kiritimatiellae bacterium]|nr:single-stranded-DNA-specific exonuclease RecJ [Kiritimatiellia bacterium]